MKKSSKMAKTPAKSSKEPPEAQATPPSSAAPPLSFPSSFGARFFSEHGRLPCILITEVSGLTDLDSPLCPSLPGKQRVMVQLMGGGRGFLTDEDGVGFCDEVLANPTNYEAACALERLCKMVGKEEGYSPLLVHSYGSDVEEYEDRFVWA